MLLNINRKISIAATMLMATWSMISAQEYKLPESHTAQHRDLIAGQINVGKQIKVEDTEQFLEGLLEEELEPEIDIYTEGWDSDRVNPYGDVMPSRTDIDVSKFSMPHPGYVTSKYG